MKFESGLVISSHLLSVAGSGGDGGLAGAIGDAQCSGRRGRLGSVISARPVRRTRLPTVSLRVRAIQFVRSTPQGHRLSTAAGPPEVSATENAQISEIWPEDLRRPTPMGTTA